MIVFLYFVAILTGALCLCAVLAWLIPDVGSTILPEADDEDACRDERERRIAEARRKDQARLDQVLGLDERPRLRALGRHGGTDEHQAEYADAAGNFPRWEQEVAPGGDQR